MKLNNSSSPKKNLLAAAITLLSLTAGAQHYKITSVITDYKGYWKSGQGVINPVKPDNSHNLLAFTYNNVRYSTGVDDAKLLANGDLFVPGDYRALPVVALTAPPISNTKIGLGEMYDGVTNGKSNPSPINSIPMYLTDGVKGLDIGTCVANLPKSAINFSVNNVKLSAINDGIPDVVITQVADPSGDYDRYEFTDIDGNRVGNAVDIVLNNLPSVGNWVADFYEASQNPMSLSAGFTKTERPLRLWTADFSVFGINASNIGNIAYFKISLSGESDVAFVAYNNNAFNVSLILPTKLNTFTAANANDGIDLNWQTATESNSSKFVIERSIDGTSFMPIGTVKAAGVSNSRRNYSFKAPSYNGRSYYRLTMTDADGKSTYSSVVSVASGSASVETTMSIYPNPATNYAIVKHPFVNGSEAIRIVNNQGITVSQVKATAGQTRLDLSRISRGIYHVVFSSANGNQTIAFVAQ